MNELKPPFDKFLMFDVESVGLHGEGFSVGWVVMQDGKEIASAEYSCDPASVQGEDDDRAWVDDNVMSWQNCSTIHTVIHHFLDAIQECYKKGFAVVTDCCYPVETNFLEKCWPYMQALEMQGPYPLYDVASVLATLGYDATAMYSRLDGELPKHNAVTDARQSARVLLEALSGTLEKP